MANDPTVTVTLATFEQLVAAVVRESCFAYVCGANTSAGPATKRDAAVEIRRALETSDEKAAAELWAAWDATTD